MVRLVCLASFIIGILGISGVGILKDLRPAACYPMIFIPVAFWIIRSIVNKNQKIEGFISLDRNKKILNPTCLTFQSQVYIPLDTDTTKWLPCSLKNLMIDLDLRPGNINCCYPIEVEIPLSSSKEREKFYLICRKKEYFEILVANMKRN